jgi:hypothetical protein
MAYTYATFQSALALYMAIPQANVTTPNFVAALPSIIDYAEQRCYRELDLLSARQNFYGTLTPGEASFDITTVGHSTLGPPGPPQFLTATASFTPPSTAIAMPPNPGTIVAGMSVVDSTAGVTLGTVLTYGPLTTSLTSNAPWSPGDFDITFSGTDFSIIPGMTVSDQTSAQPIGVVGSFERGNALTLAAPALNGSAGLTDVVTFTSSPNHVLVLTSTLAAPSRGSSDLLQFPGFQTSTPGPLPLTIERCRILPAGATIPPPPGSLTSAIPCSPVSPEWLDAVYGPGSDAGVPVWFARPSQNFLDFGPPPNQAYKVALFGMYRPVPLYSASPADGTQTTFLTTFFPDLFLAAAMINAAGYQKNFGAMMDDPKMAQSWEAQFNLLLPSAKTEEMRKRFHGWQADTAESNPPPTPMPQPGG